MEDQDKILTSYSQKPKRRKSKGEWEQIYAKMEVGESFEVQTLCESQTAIVSAKNAGVTVGSRKLEDGTYRIWKAYPPIKRKKKEVV